MHACANVLKSINECQVSQARALPDRAAIQPPNPGLPRGLQFTKYNFSDHEREVQRTKAWGKTGRTQDYPPQVALKQPENLQEELEHLLKKEL